MGKEGADLKKRADDLKRALRRPPAKDRVELERGGKHTKVRRRGNKQVVCTIPDTPSDYRSLRNVVAALSRNGIFDKVPEEVTVKTMPLPWEIRQDGFVVLDKLGYVPGATGRGAGALRRFSELIGEATFKLGLEEKQRGKDGYSDLIRKVIVQDYPTTPEGLDALIAGVEYAMHEVTRVGNKWVPEKQFEAEAEKPMVVYPATYPDTPAPVEAASVAELPKVEYEELGPLHSSNGKVSEDSLYLRILAAILDPNVTRDEALALSVEVAHLENR